MRQKPCVDGERRCTQGRPDKPTGKSQSGGRIEASRMEYGQKVTIDSATLFNKGLEVIEAMRLFEVEAKDVKVVMHRESIVHSLVEFCDGGMKGLFSVPDMRLSIETALYYPEHGKDSVAPLDLAKLGSITFSAPDYDRFPCLKIAIDAANAGEGACIAVSAADEVLVEEFLKGKIKYPEIATALQKVYGKFKKSETSNSKIFSA